MTGSGARSTTSSVRRRVVEFWLVTHATDVEHPLASRSHLPPNLPAARGRRVSGPTRGGVCSRSHIFAPPRSGRRSTPAPSCRSAGPILLIVDGAKIPGRSGSGVLVAPELVVELELLRVDAHRVRRRAGCNLATLSARLGGEGAGGYQNAKVNIVRRSWHSYGPVGTAGSALIFFSAFSLHLT